jgi:hypothetical protein
MLTCACGARFEVDGTFAGREVACPECQQRVKVPFVHQAPPRTSGLALASLTVALVGAFTPGTILAIALGIAALWSISRNRGRLTGAGFAVFGMVLGLVFGVLTLFASPFGSLADQLRERALGEEIDRSGPLEIVMDADGFAITRPSEKWGRLQTGHLDDPVVGSFQKERDLVLVQPRRLGFVDVRVERKGRFGPLDRWEYEVLNELGPSPRPRNLRFGEDDGDVFSRLRSHAQLVGPSQRLDEPGREGLEMLIDVRVARQQFRFLVRVYRQRGGSVYVVRAYTSARRFAGLEAELRQALDSFRILR